ncbi:class I SAM-dependent methyltransferase [Mucilaginibacter rubeus]|uniref:Class I SAM-dependent methyltransferase n=2 Tax=Mucilaginibacter rubeus TaxID=2027860 RepID=A0A364WTW7_9SPHI|nr:MULTISPECIES: class I SAM-dependent methyltransferase [Mucilaginibacter]QEM06158.1 class I SAM-dependent methyltransferase [Mucilaginibacter rubeus]QEM13675.1 class I SAM-dependent methyltransferase [Mucilaginibacter rubeus]QEM18740.1 class I SAM-dependent methyltransferase [Mucilaginibacter gossypii]QTE36266.1 class I SAM-dependent methyltransferase [Mucilaginibacter gossypii]QTE44719.1 class I SAM-dependent methyltransferase [Mucilaginibacter rubeus]
MRENKKTHWEQVYQTKKPDQVSWTQSVPQTSLDFIHSFDLSKTSKIIDIGGGDSKLVDYLLQEGFEDITVLDISTAALQKAQERLGKKSELVKWIISDIVDFKPDEYYDLWHDRATFHFLTGQNQIAAYLDIAGRSVKNYLVIGTFSENGPEQCSGLSIKQYTEEQLQNQLTKDFKKIRCIHEDHVTPFQTTQNFLFCSFEKSSL